jgi:hypothetical protein
MVGTMIDSGLTSLGIVDRDLVSKDELMKQNAMITDELFHRTRELLEPLRQVFEWSIAVLLREENLSGDAFRELLVHVKKSA